MVRLIVSSVTIEHRFRSPDTRMKANRNYRRRCRRSVRLYIGMLKFISESSKRLGSEQGTIKLKNEFEFVLFTIEWCWKIQLNFFKANVIRIFVSVSSMPTDFSDIEIDYRLPNSTLWSHIVSNTHCVHCRMMMSNKQKKKGKCLEFHFNTFFIVFSSTSERNSHH